MDLSEFWSRFQSGIDVATCHSESDKLLGVRDGFHRFFHDGLERPVPVSVTPFPDGEDILGYIPMTDEEILQRALERVLELRARVGDAYAFFASSETGLHPVTVESQAYFFVRTWTAVSGPVGEAFGGSTSIQLPASLVAGLSHEQLPFAVPGTRRRGGMASSLTGGLATRRSTVGEATLGAVASMLYPVLESRSVRGR